MGPFDAWNLPDKEFDAVMTEIDAELRRENDRIVGREIRGWTKFCQRFHISVALGDPVAGRIIDWFKAIYGDRLNVDLDFGKSFVSIRSDTYRIRCFRFYGAMYAICSVEMLGRKIQHRGTDGPERTIINLLDEHRGTHSRTGRAVISDRVRRDSDPISPDVSIFLGDGGGIGRATRRR